MGCIVSYLKNLDISEEDKQSLSNIHNKIFDKAHESKSFRLIDGKLYTFKYKLQDATKFVSDVNQEYGTQVVKIVKESVLKSKLAINVEGLINSKQGNLDFVSPNEEEITKKPRIFDNKVNYSLAIVNSLYSDKVRQPNKNFQGFINDLTKLGTSKEQLELLKDNYKEGDTKDDLITKLLANNSYTVEVNTSRTTEPIGGYSAVILQQDEDGNPTFRLHNNFYFINNNKYYQDTGEETTEIGKIRFEELMKQVIPTNEHNSNFYSNLTVPGGTNYTENEIATPDIIPSIKGHAQFATDKGIGWFRSDETATGMSLHGVRRSKFGNLDYKTYTTDGSVAPKYGPITKIVEYDNTKNTGETGKKIEFTVEQFAKERPEIYKEFYPEKKDNTRRILELQSDLFQKGRNREILTNEATEHFDFADFNDDTRQWEVNTPKEEINKKISKGLKENKFLQLLNKDNNWVKFFIQSIIQDSAKKGYEKVVFPAGNTAAKVEGHTTLEEFKKQKEERIQTIQNEIKKEEVKIKNKEYPKDEIKAANLGIAEFESEITQLQEELERVEKEGFAALRPIFKFYEETIYNTLKKNYKDLKRIKDEYGNEWFQIDIKEEHLSSILIGNSNEISKRIVDSFSGEIEQSLIDDYKKMLDVSDEELNNKKEECK